MQRDITSHILKFRDFLVTSWPILDALMENHDWEDDIDFTDEWLTANWEFLVERELLGQNDFLTSFGCSFYEQRVCKPDAQPQYTVIGIPKKDVDSSKSPLRLYGFVTPLEGGGFGYYPPFDIALLVEYGTKNLHKIAVNSLNFHLISIDQIM